MPLQCCLYAWLCMHGDQLDPLHLESTLCSETPGGHPRRQRRNRRRIDTSTQRKHAGPRHADAHDGGGRPTGRHRRGAAIVGTAVRSGGNKFALARSRSALVLYSDAKPSHYLPAKPTTQCSAVVEQGCIIVLFINFNACVLRLPLRSRIESATRWPDANTLCREPRTGTAPGCWPSCRVASTSCASA